MGTSAWDDSTEKGENTPTFDELEYLGHTFADNQNEANLWNNICISCCEV